MLIVQLSFELYMCYGSENEDITRPSFPLGELGTFALFKLPAFWWGTFIKMKVVYMKC